MSSQTIVKATHFPSQLSPIAFLKCSCGYEGNIVLKNYTGEEDSSPDNCPNCGSPTVHQKHVKEVATTIHHFENGENETVTAKQEEKKAPKTEAAPVTKDEIVEAVMQHPIFDRLSKFMDEQDKKAATAGTSTGKDNTSNV